MAHSSRQTPETKSRDEIKPSEKQLGAGVPWRVAWGRGSRTEHDRRSGNPSGSTHQQQEIMSLRQWQQPR